MFISHSVNETEAFAASIAATLHPGDVVALYGGMGAGKTAFVRGLARGLGYGGDVSSPTFAIINEYRGGRLPLFHFDMYRVTGWDDLESTNFYDYVEAGGVAAVEWSENIEAALPEGAIRVRMEKNGKIGKSERIIQINNRQNKPPTE